MSQQKRDKVSALKALEKELKDNQKACRSAWSDGSPFLTLCMQKSVTVFEKKMERVLNGK